MIFFFFSPQCIFSHIWNHVLCFDSILFYKGQWYKKMEIYIFLGIKWTREKIEFAKLNFMASILYEYV